MKNNSEIDIESGLQEIPITQRSRSSEQSLLAPSNPTWSSTTTSCFFAAALASPTISATIGSALLYRNDGIVNSITRSAIGTSIEITPMLLACKVLSDYFTSQQSVDDPEATPTLEWTGSTIVIGFIAHNIIPALLGAVIIGPDDITKDLAAAALGSLLVIAGVAGGLGVRDYHQARANMI